MKRTILMGLCAFAAANLLMGCKGGGEERREDVPLFVVEDTLPTGAVADDTLATAGSVPDREGKPSVSAPNAGKQETERAASVGRGSTRAGSYQSAPSDENEAGRYGNMRGFDPRSEDDMDDNGMSRYMENNDEEGWE